MALKLFSRKPKRARGSRQLMNTTSLCIWIDKEMYAQLKKMAEISEVPTRQLVQVFCRSGMDAWTKNQKNLQLIEKYAAKKAAAEKASASDRANTSVQCT